MFHLCECMLNSTCMLNLHHMFLNTNIYKSSISLSRGKIYIWRKSPQEEERDKQQRMSNFKWTLAVAIATSASTRYFSCTQPWLGTNFFLLLPSLYTTNSMNIIKNIKKKKNWKKNRLYIKNFKINNYN